MLCNNALESSKAATERARRASKYGSDAFELIDIRDSVDLLLASVERREGPGLVVVREVVLVVVVVVVVLITVACR